MNELSVTKPYQRRRRFSREFKADIIRQCQEPGASVSRISLDNGLNANMVRRWISEARRANKATSKTPGFVPVNLPTVDSAQSNQSVPNKRSTIRIEIPRAGGAVVVEWPAEQAHQCAALLRDLLG
ncbi:IS66-like element accessory protein TnpA [Marinobacter xiaoshiensis]|uniref:Transposase n=1 Tax=Marinobacter xiaoshiensis TaxID=3073652 RepID=A0ABU2HN00_9GAMM|nr:transposase [Marinobacter sp. F60267]MDS1311700.1 transposase [Marinobacter sp. F60267]